jgi:methyltransferase-like protein
MKGITISIDRIVIDFTNVHWDFFNEFHKRICHLPLRDTGNESDNVAVRYIKGINYIVRIDNADKLSYFLYNGHGDVVQTVSETGEVENR